MADTRLALDDTIHARLQTLGPELATIKRSPNSTIIPPELRDTAGERALAMLGEARGRHEGITLRETLGEGGMGIVRSGMQLSLGRTVAIKTLRHDHRRPADVLTLLREAWVTGSLEHPNILPIYDVKLDDEGMPLVVLKRIEGVDWAEILNDPQRMKERLGEGDLLEHNLEVLMQVCHAIAFAHSRGFVHRDIKPDNVRIGSFGEVYVLDWGIAVALEDDGTGRFPLAKNATAMAGTPSYMAPEMLGGNDFGPISPRTDVYLLGATLHEIAVGHPPHDKPTPTAVITSVLQSTPKLEGVPDELADIIRRAMAMDHEVRYESAEELRLAIGRFIAHRGADKLVANALARLAELEALVRDGGEEVRVAAHDRLGACRTGFMAALDVSSDNAQAHHGLQRAVETMADYELRRGDARAAEELLKQLDAPSSRLAARVERGLEKQLEAEARQSELEALGKDLDPATGTRTRFFVGVVCGVMWCAVPILGIFSPRSTAYDLQLLMVGIVAITAAGLFYWARESLMKTAYNRRMAITVFLALGMTLITIGGGILMQLPPAQLGALFPLVWAGPAAMLAITTERRLWPGMVGYVLAFFGSAAFPAQRFIFMSLSNALFTATFAVVWRPTDTAPPSSLAQPTDA